MQLYKTCKTDGNVRRLVQPVDDFGKKEPGEWLLDIALTHCISFVTEWITQWSILDFIGPSNQSIALGEKSSPKTSENCCAYVLIIDFTSTDTIILRVGKTRLSNVVSGKLRYS